MKRLIYLIIVVAVSFASCRPDRICCEVPQPSARVFAERNGQPWNTFAVRSQLGVTDSLIIGATEMSDNSFPQVKTDSLTFKIANGAVGTYQLNADQAFYSVFNVNGGPTAYKLDPTFNNVFTVASYTVLDNPATTVPDPTQITGTFSVRFIDPISPAGITFSGGNFKVLTVHQ